MKVLTTLIVALVASQFSFAEVERDGSHSNPTNRTERSTYHNSPELKVWTEFGRAYWKPATAAAATTKTTTKTVTNNDTDRDGVTNKLDQCPGTPYGTTVNAFGCEDSEKVSINLGVRFASGKAVLNESYTSQLDRLGETMKKHENLKIEIQGHTDGTGKRSYNLWISQKRSDAVKTYLMEKHGISADRLVTRGYGPDQPVATNDTATGRRANRRVEGRIIAQ